ncbi:MFS transporter [Acrocarpospora catenulata]|uniref:MFS transporter n=1 Tax=Acrocarpospora catenulata TaxID=2836182 RepID=UPI001BDAA320|nr:MFS transporter [Acrocarpospora catenulata]
MRRILPDLPREAWRILAGNAVSAFGSGLTLPFFLVYLHNVRGIEVGLAGPILSAIAVAGLVGNPLGGQLADRFGARQAATAGLVVSAIGTAGMAGVQSAWQGLAAAVVYGLGIAITAPAFQALIGISVPKERRQQIFAVQYVMMNVGFSAGGLLAAFLVSSSPQSFVTLYLLDAATFLAFAVLIARSPGGRVQGVRSPVPRGGYREILSDRPLLRICVLVAALFTCGYAQYSSAYPIYAMEEGGLDAAALRLTFLANTCTVVIAQFLVLRLLKGRRRTRGFALSAALMAAAWVTVLWAAAEGGAVGMAGFTVAMALFAVGETLMAPTVPTIVNDLAPDSARGRYNGAFSLATTLGYIIGPALAGAVLTAGLGSALFAVMALALGLVAVQALRLERRLPDAVNIVTAAADNPAAGPRQKEGARNE